MNPLPSLAPVVSDPPEYSIETASNAGEVLFRQCAWCKKFVNERGEYVRIPAWAMPAQKDVSHGICPPCALDLLKGVR